jgi:hypothetical protein
MDITNYSWWYETLNKVIFQTDFIVMNMYIIIYNLNKFIYDSYTCIFTLFISVLGHI